MRKFITVIMLFNLCACSLFVPRRQTISVTTTQENAEIYINGDFAGVGRVTKKVPKDEDVSILAKKEGFYPAQKEVDTKISITGILDGIGTFIFLFPAFGFLSAGAWDLEQTNVTVIMYEEK